VRKKVLGKGLEALIPQNLAGTAGGGNVVELGVDEIVPNPRQPRKKFDQDKLKLLSDSIKEDGVLQPVVVRKKEDGYELIMGERRLQAARLAGVPKVPVVVKNVKDIDSLRLSVVENIQREDLNDIEVAKAYHALVATFGMTQAELAQFIGRERSSVANSLRLLNLPPDVQQMIVDEKLTAGHARALLSMPTHKEQLALAQRIIETRMSVREAEAAAGLKVTNKKQKAEGKQPKEKPSHIVYLETALANHLGTKVSIEEKRGGRGKMTVEFYSHEDFERLASLMHLPLPR
jgi:ParB family chromosome partitioning protein